MQRKVVREMEEKKIQKCRHGNTKGMMTMKLEIHRNKVEKQLTYPKIKSKKKVGKNYFSRALS